jgi:hypothetical protein
MQAPRGGVEGLVDHRAGSARTMIGPGAKSNSDRSAPAQKPRPAPVSTSARIRIVGLGLVQRGPQLAVHLAREAVERLRAVQREDGDGAFVRVKNGGLSRLGCSVVIGLSPRASIYH